MGSCAICGKELGWRERYQLHFDIDRVHPEYKDKKFCHGCFDEILREVRNTQTLSFQQFQQQKLEQPFKEALEEGRRVVVIRDAVLTSDGIGKHLEKTSRIAEKFGYIFKSESHTSDMFGNPNTFYMTFEKNTETQKFVNCDHCTTRYDANQYFKCPKCGAPAT